MSELNQTEMQGFKIKLVNLRKKNFPDELKETDYLSFRVGDILRKGTSSTIYKVVGLQRGNIRKGLYDYYFNTGMKVTGNDPKFKEIMEKYKESSNFGVCIMKIVPIMKNYQPITAKRIAIVSELDQICTHTSRKYWKSDIRLMEQGFINKINKNKYKVSVLNNSIAEDEKKGKALNNLYFQHCMPVCNTVSPEETENNNENPF